MRILFIMFLISTSSFSEASSYERVPLSEIAKFKGRKINKKMTWKGVEVASFSCIIDGESEDIHIYEGMPLDTPLSYFEFVELSDSTGRLLDINIYKDGKLYRNCDNVEYPMW